MKITITGVSTIDSSDKIDMTIEYLDGKTWGIKVNKAEFTTTELESVMAFLKEAKK